MTPGIALHSLSIAATAAIGAIGASLLAQTPSVAAHPDFAALLQSAGPSVFIGYLVYVITERNIDRLVKMHREQIEAQERMQSRDIEAKQEIARVLTALSSQIDHLHEVVAGCQGRRLEGPSATHDPRPGH